MAQLEQAILETSPAALAESPALPGSPDADIAVGAAGSPAARMNASNLAADASAAVSGNGGGEASDPAPARRAPRVSTAATRRVAAKTPAAQTAAEAAPQPQAAAGPVEDAATTPAVAGVAQGSAPSAAPTVDEIVADLPAVRTRAVRADRGPRLDRAANADGGGGGVPAPSNFQQEPRMRLERPDRDRGNGNDRSERMDRTDRDRDRDRDRPERGMVRQMNGSANGNNGNADIERGNNNNNGGGIPQFATGILEILNEGWGFLRHGNFDQNGQDVYVAQAQIKRFALRTGDTVYGQVRPPKESEKYFGLLRVDKVNGVDPDVARHRPNFDELVPIYPDDRLILEIDPKNIPAPIATPRENPDPHGLTARFIDLIAPVGKGQRAIIVAPPKAGKTTILKTVALSIAVNHPDVHLIAVLIDERPEEVTDIRRFVQHAYAGREAEGKPVGEVISSTFDEQPENHMRVADMVLERAKRLVELGKDVCVLLDSLTRLSRASNLTVTPSGRTLQGGLDPAAIYRPKRFFGAARNIENGGSLTIIASSLVETGSRMDDIIFEEFKGTGNMELKLDRGLAERRTFPAIDIKASGTRKDELLYDADSLKSVVMLHRVLASFQTAEAAEFLSERLGKCKTNKEFLAIAGKTN